MPRFNIVATVIFDVCEVDAETKEDAIVKGEEEYQRQLMDGLIGGELLTYPPLTTKEIK